jgi:hypothetical protein
MKQVRENASSIDGVTWAENIERFEAFCDRVSKGAAARGMTETVLNDLLASGD